MTAEVRWCGDQHIALVVGDAVDLPTVLRVVDLNARLLRSELSELIVETVPTWCSILIHFRLGAVRPRELAQRVLAWLDDSGSKDAIEIASRIVTLPVLYGGEMGPDLQLVADANGLSIAETVRRLAEGTHLVGMISFIPGQANCMWLEPKLALSAPKYSQPRTYTPEGTVGLGGSSIALYSVPSPGGFQMVGRMPVPTYSPHPILPAFEESPILLRVGDRLRLKSIDRDEYDTAAQEVREGRYRFQIQESVLTVEATGASRARV